jgi:hypothetical protein
VPNTTISLLLSGALLRDIYRPLCRFSCKRRISSKWKRPAIAVVDPCPYQTAQIGPLADLHSTMLLSIMGMRYMLLAGGTQPGKPGMSRYPKPARNPTVRTSGRDPCRCYGDAVTCLTGDHC